MKVSTMLPGTMRYPPITQEWETRLEPADYQLIARTADELGFDAIVVPEHIVVPDDMVELMGSHWSHAMTVMSFLAGATSRILVDASVLVLPYHQPVVLAKAVATLDVLSGGRVRLSIGVGHAEREFEVLGVPFHERGAIADEYLAAMIELWTPTRRRSRDATSPSTASRSSPSRCSRRIRRSGSAATRRRRCAGPSATTAGIRGSSDPTTWVPASTTCARCPSSSSAPVRRRLDAVHRGGRRRAAPAHRRAAAADHTRSSATRSCNRSSTSPAAASPGPPPRSPRRSRSTSTSTASTGSPTRSCPSCA